MVDYVINLKGLGEWREKPGCVKLKEFYTVIVFITYREVDCYEMHH